MGIKRITICHKRNDCIGCGSCAHISPTTWSMNEVDGKADLKEGKWKGDMFVVAESPEEEYEKNKQAAEVCPMGSIRIEKSER